MTHLIVKKGSLQGEMTIPSSKSQTLRAILFAAMASGKSKIFRYLDSPDTSAMIRACRLIGARIDLFPDRIEIEGISGKIDHADDVIDAGNSGIVLRFFTALGTLASHPTVITGDDSIKYRRPMKALIDALTVAGADIRSMRGDGFAPIIVNGPLKKSTIAVQGEDSQHVSALLIASAFARGSTRIEVGNPGEIPWVALTLDWLTRLNIPFTNRDFRTFTVEGNASYSGFEYTVPGDLSTVAFPLVAALATRSDLLLKNIEMTDPQGDKQFISVLIEMGAAIEYDAPGKCLFIKGDSSLRGIDADINSYIDMITPLAVTGCFAEGKTRIYNAEIAGHKECNRILATASELRKMGASVTVTDDGLIVEKSRLTGASVDSHQDHRMAMSLCVSGMGAEGITIVDSSDCIKKTYPTFVEDFRKSGANVEERAD